jgi:hypothetical protein
MKVTYNLHPSSSINLSDYIRSSFDGILVLGDIHSNIEAFLKAVDFCKKENYFLLSLGDLVDYGHNPFEVIDALHELWLEERAGFVIGNHDDKFYRYYKGNKVRLSHGQEKTLELVGNDRLDDFFKKYMSIIEDPIFSSLYHRIGNFVFSHGAFHSSMVLLDEGVENEMKAYALYGETNGEYESDGFPVRLYNWIHDIPENVVSIVGHDRKPVFGETIFSPLHVTGNNGGKVIFMDTGCSKGGYLSGLAISINDRKFKIDKSLEFK